MAKLKEGEKVEQTFTVTLKFKAVDGDERFNARLVRDIMTRDCEREYGQEHGVKVVVKEVKEGYRIPA